MASIPMAVVRIDATTDAGPVVGSGFLVGQGGMVVTSESIIRGARSAIVTFRDGTLHRVEGTLARLPEREIAILKITMGPGAVRGLPIAVAPPRPGEPVVAFGYSDGVPPSESRGSVVEAGARPQWLDAAESSQSVNVIYTDAVISPENRGGPLVNSQGLVVGVNTLVDPTADKANLAVASTEILQGIGSATSNAVAPLTSEMKGPVAAKSEISPISPALQAKIVNGLEAYRQQWLQDFAAQLATRREQVQVLETEIRTKQALIDTVKDGGAQAIETMQRFPLTRSRSEWLRTAREYVDSLQKQLDEEQVGLQEDQRLLDQRLYPPPALPLRRLAIGRFGFVHAYGQVSQLLDDGTFLAYFDGDVQLHCRGFDVDNVIDDKVLHLSMMCLVSGNYGYVTVTGARRTVFTLEPLDLKVLPEQFQQALKARAEYQQEKHAGQLDEWQTRVVQSKARVADGGSLPRLGTRFEPETLIDLLTGDARIKPPSLPRRFEIDRRLQTRVDPLTGVRWSRVVTSRVETAESKVWRRRQLAEFEGRKAVYPAYALDDFLNELSTWTENVELIYNVDNRLQKDLHQLTELAFGRYGVTRQNRVQDIPWTPEDKMAIIALLTELAIRYGEIADEAAPDESETVEDSSRTAAEQIEILESKIRRKRILLRNMETIDPRHQTIEEQLRKLEAALEAVKSPPSQNGKSADDGTE